MTKRKKTGGTKAVAMILAAVMAVGVFVGIGRAESNAVCGAALEKCMAVGLTMGFLAGLWEIFVGAGSCILGYDFCKKYVAPAK